MIISAHKHTHTRTHSHMHIQLNKRSMYSTSYDHAILFKLYPALIITHIVSLHRENQFYDSNAIAIDVSMGVWLRQTSSE